MVNVNGKKYTDMFDAINNEISDNELLEILNERDLSKHQLIDLLDYLQIQLEYGFKEDA